MEATQAGTTTDVPALLQKWLPNLTMLEVSADAHFFPVTATEETAAVIDNWIKSQGG